MAEAPGQVETHPLPMGERVVVTIGVMMAVLLQVLDTTIANVALPHMQASLSASQESINWVHPIVLRPDVIIQAGGLMRSVGWLANPLVQLGVNK